MRRLCERQRTPRVMFQCCLHFPSPMVFSDMFWACRREWSAKLFWVHRCVPGRKYNKCHAFLRHYPLLNELSIVMLARVAFIMSS